MHYLNFLRARCCGVRDIMRGVLRACFEWRWETHQDHRICDPTENKTTRKFRIIFRLFLFNIIGRQKYAASIECPRRNERMHSRVAERKKPVERNHESAHIFISSSKHRTSTDWPRNDPDAFVLNSNALIACYVHDGANTNDKWIEAPHTANGFFVNRWKRERERGKYWNLTVNHWRDLREIPK